MSKTFVLLAVTALISSSLPAAQAADLARKMPAKIVVPAKQIVEARSSEEILRSAMQKYESKDLRGALAEFDQLIKLNPNSAVAYASRGNVKDDLGNPQGALADYNKALSLDRRDYSTYFNRGVTYARLEKYQQAITDFETAIELNANYATAHRNLGMIKYVSAANKADKEAGLAHVRKSVALYRFQGAEAKAAASEAIAQQMLQDLSQTTSIN